MQLKSWNLESLKITGMITLSLIAIGVCPIFYKLLESEISPIASIFNRLGGSTIVFGTWVLFRFANRFSPPDLQRDHPTLKDYILLLISSLLFWMSQASWAWSLTQTSVAISDLLHSLIPLFVILGGWLIGNKVFTPQFLLGTGISIAGSCLIGIEHLSGSPHKFNGDMAAMLSAVLLGTYILIGEFICTKFSNTVIMLWVCLIGALLSLPILSITQVEWFPISLHGWLFVGGLIITMVLGQGLLLYGIEQVGASLMSVLTLLEPILAGIVAWFVFAEALSYLDIGAMFIVLFGVYLSISQPLKYHPEQLG